MGRRELKSNPIVSVIFSAYYHQPFLISRSILLLRSVCYFFSCGNIFFLLLLRRHHCCSMFVFYFVFFLFFTCFLVLAQWIWCFYCMYRHCEYLKRKMPSCRFGLRTYSPSLKPSSNVVEQIHLLPSLHLHIFRYCFLFIFSLASFLPLFSVQIFLFLCAEYISLFLYYRFTFETHLMILMSNIHMAHADVAIDAIAIATAVWIRTNKRVKLVKQQNERMKPNKRSKMKIVFIILSLPLPVTIVINVYSYLFLGFFFLRLFSRGPLSSSKQRWLFSNSMKHKDVGEHGYCY